MHLLNLNFCEPLKLDQLTLAISLDELVNTHVAATNPDDQLIVHNFSIDFLASEHVESTTQSRNRKVDSVLQDVLL